MRSIACFLTFSLTIALSACGEGTVEKETFEIRKVTPTASKQKIQESQPEAAEPLPPAYVYDPSDLRDPFVPLLEVKKAALTPQVSVPMTPLQKFDLGQFRLTAVIVGKGEPRAMVSAPDGKSYILKKGIMIGKNNGKVVGIKKEAVLVDEKYYDFAGKVITKQQMIELPKREGVL